MYTVDIHRRYFQSNTFRLSRMLAVGSAFDLDLNINLREFPRHPAPDGPAAALT